MRLSSRIAVDVVDILIWEQGSSEMRLHDETML